MYYFLRFYEKDLEIFRLMHSSVFYAQCLSTVCIKMTLKVTSLVHAQTCTHER